MTTETNLKALYTYVSLYVHNLIRFICSECTDFCLQLCFLEKGKTTLTKPFTFWKWKHISKKNHILEMKGHSETHFETRLMLPKIVFFFYFCYLPWNWVELFDKLSRPHKNYNFEASGDFILLWPQPMSNFYTKHSCYDTLTLEKSSPWKEMCIK